MVIEKKKKDKFRIFRNGVRELLNLEGLFPPWVVRNKTNKIMVQNKKVTLVFKALI